MVISQLKLQILWEEGKVYAVDVYPDSIDTVKNEIKKRKIEKY